MKLENGTIDKDITDRDQINTHLARAKNTLQKSYTLVLEKANKGNLLRILVNSNQNGIIERNETWDANKETLKNLDTVLYCKAVDEYVNEKVLADLKSGFVTVEELVEDNNGTDDGGKPVK